MKLTTMWAIGTVALCAVVGFAVWYTRNLGPMWLLLLPFMVSIKSEGGGHQG